MDFLISTWLPRSYLHLREAHSKLDQIDLKITKVSFKENLSFTIKNAYQKYSADFVFYSTGVYTVHIKTPSNVSQAQLIKAIKKIILEKLIKNWHSVTYKQIKNQVIPLVYSTIIFSSPKKKTKPTDNDLLEYFKDKYKKNNRSVYRSYQFINILSRIIDQYIEIMSGYYHQADKVANSLKGDFELSELKKTVFEMDLVEKITGETNARINDAQDCLDREIEELRSNNSSLLKKLNVEKLFSSAVVDLNYTKRLWGQLDNFLDNLDNASNARLSFQETVESRRLAWFLSIESASVIATLVLSAFVSEFTGINAIYMALTFAVVWILVYLAMMRLRAK